MAGINVELAENGPYRVTGDFQLLDAKRKQIKTAGIVELCRCGESKDKPLCDGVACANGFETADEIVPGSRREYTGEAISVSFDASRCIHMSACLSNAPDVFDVRKRPWIKLEGADAERVAKAVERCPTGALRYRRLDGGNDEEPGQPTTIRVMRNGPYRLRGDIQITTSVGGQSPGSYRISLCRCGSSRNKPFCDNSHEMVNFQAP